MLSDDELQALRDIERRLRWHSPQLVQLFNSVEPQPATDHRQRARTRVLLAAAALTGMALLGPRMLNETEIRTQRRAPLPHTAAADTATARPTMFATPAVERPDDLPTSRARANQRISTTQARAELGTK